MQDAKQAICQFRGAALSKCLFFNLGVYNMCDAFDITTSDLKRIVEDEYFGYTIDSDEIDDVLNTLDHHKIEKVALEKYEPADRMAAAEVEVLRQLEDNHFFVSSLNEK